MCASLLPVAPARRAVGCGGRRMGAHGGAWVQRMKKSKTLSVAQIRNMTGCWHRVGLRSRGGARRTGA